MEGNDKGNIFSQPPEKSIKFAPRMFKNPLMSPEFLGKKLNPQNDVSDDNNENLSSNIEEHLNISKQHPADDTEENKFDNIFDEPKDKLDDIENSDQPFEDQVVPALAKKNKAKELQDEGGNPPKERAPIEPLTEDAHRYADQFNNIFSQKILEMLFSRYWYHREEGIVILNKEFTTKKFENIVTQDNDKIVQSLIGISSELCNDKAIQVSLNALNLLESVLCEELKSKEESKKIQSIEWGIEILIKKLGDSNPKIKSTSESICSKLAKLKKSIADLLIKMIIIKPKNAL